jgi:peptidoglycan hydrolase-like protein with peptidoglycan-binding domain
MIMKKLASFLCAAMVILPVQVFAISDNSASVTIAQLQEQIKVLQAQVAELTSKLTMTQTEVATIKEELRLTKTLRLGMTDNEVSKLQSFLKTMPDVYPEGLVTGYFGQLTAKAVKKFQEKNAGDVLKPLGLSEGTGIVGEKTMEKMNKVIAESATTIAGGTSNSAKEKEEKVTLCHFPPENPINKQTIIVGSSAVPAHKAHGDTMGACTGEQLPSAPAPTPVPTACTTDAKLCSNGSYVKRVSPNCEFASCPVNPTHYYIKIAAPSRNETWTTGSSYYIKWSSNIPSTHNIMIVRVRDSAGSEFNLLRDTQNDGIELLTIPSTLASGIYHFEMKTVYENWTAFSEIEGMINIVNPNNPTPITETRIITPSVNGGYGVLGGTSVVVVGSDQTFTITPMPGYKVASVIVDGVNQGSMMSYTFTNVQANHSIVVSFSPIQPAPIAQYSISVTQGEYGTISPASALVASGGSQTFTITPGSGYQIASVVVDGVSQGAISSYTFSNVQASHTISATFLLLPVTVTQSCTLTVSLSSATPVAQFVTPGQSAVPLVKFNATPNCNGTLNSFAVSLLPMPNGYQNISSLRLYNDATGAQLGTTQSVTTAGMNFPGVNIPLTANHTLVLKVVGDVSSSASIGGTVYGTFGGSYGVTGSGGVIGNNASGNLISGNTMTVAAASVGLPAPTELKVGFGIGSGVANWVKISESFNFKYDLARIGEVSAFRLYQKKPEDSSYTMVGEFSNPSGLTTCSTKRIYGTWTLTSLGGGPTGCPGSGWHLSRTSSYPVASYTVGDYFYYVTAVNTSGVEGPTSLLSFTTFLGTFPIQTPITVETAGSLNPTFRWQPAGGSSQLLSYWVIVAPSDGSGSQVMLTPFSSSGPDISKVYDGPALIPGKQYSVWIYGRSHNTLQTEDLSSYASEAATFSVSP